MPCCVGAVLGAALVHVLLVIDDGGEDVIDQVERNNLRNVGAHVNYRLTHFVAPRKVLSTTEIVWQDREPPATPHTKHWPPTHHHTLEM